LNLISKINKTKYTLWIFTFVTILTASFSPIFSQTTTDKTLDKTNEKFTKVQKGTTPGAVSGRLESETNTGFPSSAFGNMFFKDLTKKEVSARTNGYYTNCTSSDGLFIVVIEKFGQKVGNGVQGRDLECSLKEAQNGNPQAFYDLLDNSSPGLNDAVMALNGSILEQRPASGIEYFSQKVYALQNVGRVNAQDASDLYYRGTGFDLLKPIQGLWGYWVNFVYSLLIFIIIVVAFGIMFRSKLSGSAVITLQNSIPNIALAMILVPMSYAISGLFIDGITVGVNVVHELILGPQSPARPVYENRNIDFPLNQMLGYELRPESFIDRGLHADDIRVSWIYAGSNVNIKDEVQGAFQTITIATGILEWTNGLIDGIGGWIAPIINFIVGVVLLLTGLRIFWFLVQKFAIFILFPLFSPLIFASVAIPGTGTKNVIWYAKMLWAGTLSYIVSYAMILLSIVFASSYFQNLLPSFGTTTFVPPLLGLDILFTQGTTGATGVGNGVVGVYAGLIALMIFLNIPPTLEDINKKLGVTNNIIPTFFTTGLKSWKDSVALGKNIRNRAFGAVSGAWNRVRGVKPGDYGSLEYYLKRPGAGARSFIGRNLTNRGGAAGALGRAASSVLDAAEGVAGGVTGGNLKSTEGARGEQTLKVQLGEIVVPIALVRQLYNQYGLDIMNNLPGNQPTQNMPPIIDLGKDAKAELVFQADKFELPDLVDPDEIGIKIADYLGGAGGFTSQQGYGKGQFVGTGLSSQGAVWAGSGLTPIPLASSADFQTNLNQDNKLFQVGAATQGGLVLVPDQMGQEGIMDGVGPLSKFKFRTANRKQFSIRLSLKIIHPDADTLRRIFGVYDTDFKVFRDGLFTYAGVIKGKQGLAFSISGYKSEPVEAKIKLG
jgi:hypothetical protein